MKNEQPLPADPAVPTLTDPPTSDPERAIIEAALPGVAPGLRALFASDSGQPFRKPKSKTQEPK